MNEMHKKLLFIIPTLFFFLFFSFHPVSAAISACAVTVSPSVLDGGTSSQLVFSITNNDQDSNLLYWVKVIAPSSDFTLTSGDGPSLGGVTISDDKSSVVINTTLSGGETGDFTIGVTAGNNGVSSAAFTILSSATSGGDDPTTCTGDSSVSISGNTQAILNISNVRVSTNDSSATLSWSTGGNTTGLVDYGTSTSYGSQATDSNLSASHSVSLSGLSASTTYHFRITSTDSNQNSVQSSDNTFITGSTGAVTTVTTTTTTIKNVVQIKEVKDTTPPSVSISSELKGVYASSPEIEGKASDDGGIAEVLYSVDEGKNWLHVNIGTIGAKKVNFTFSPEIHEDGNYEIILKAIDSSGNEKVGTASTVVIDRLPPLAGGVVLSVGPQIITPNASGALVVLAGLSSKLTFSAVGGPTAITISVGDHSFKANKNFENGLWSVILENLDMGTYSVVAHEIDGANNKTDQELSNLIVLPGGNITLNNQKVTVAELAVYFYDPQTLTFSLWDASEYQQENPQRISNGSYKLLLPPGTYYIEVTAPFTKSLISNIFTVQASNPITTNFNVTLKRLIQIGPFKIALPNFLQGNDSVTIETKKSEETPQKKLIGQEFPYFKFGSQDSNNLRGKPVLISLVSSWHPQAVEQLNILDDMVRNKGIRAVAIMSQEGEKSVDIFGKRGGYTMPIVADRDGILIQRLDLKSIPTHYFTDRKGIIRFVVTGLLKRDEIEGIMSTL
jgi:hypothetical protein